MFERKGCDRKGKNRNAWADPGRYSVTERIDLQSPADVPGPEDQTRHEIRNHRAPGHAKDAEGSAHPQNAETQIKETFEEQGWYQRFVLAEAQHGSGGHGIGRPKQ